MAVTSLHGRHDVLARDVAAEQVAVRRRHAAERRVASGRHPRKVQVHRAGIAQTNGEVSSLWALEKVLPS